MALYSLDIQKRLGSEFWTNRYLANADSIANAVVIMNGIVDSERTIHSTLVGFVNGRASSVAVEDEVYSIVPYGTLGQRSGGGLLPLFNTLRMDLQAGSGRPSRKFYRGVLQEGDIDGDAVTVATSFSDHADYLASIAVYGETLEGIVGPQGEGFANVIVWPFVQMRQLRRGTRKRSNPIFQ